MEQNKLEKQVPEAILVPYNQKHFRHGTNPAKKQAITAYKLQA